MLNPAGCTTVEPMTTTHEQTAPAPSTTRPLKRLGVAAIGLALLSAAMWFAWLGWDDEYHLVDGEQQGPYQAWQVIGCGASIALASVAAYVWTRGAWSVVLLPVAAVVGFAVPWTVHAASTDDSGLYVVGLVLLVVGAGAGLTALLGATAGVLRAYDRSRPTG